MTRSSRWSSRTDPVATTKKRLEKIARSKLRGLYQTLETRVHPLRYLFLEITSRCNLSCLHCGSDCGRNPGKGELTTEQWIDFIEDLPRSFDAKKLFVILTGGEPLCHPELDRIIDALRAASVRWSMVTNGWLLSDERLAHLLSSGMESMTVSLDGARESHDWLRGKPGSFDRAVNGITLLARSNIPIFDVVTCANPRNLDELPQVEALLREVGVKRWRLFSIFPKGRAKENRKLILNPAQIKQLLAWIAARRRAGEGKDFQLDFCCEGYLPVDVDRKVRDEPYFCRAGINIGSVLADGAISACPNISRALVQGNILDRDFASVWENGFQPYRDRSWLKKGPCKDCDEWSRCRGNSLHLYDESLGHTVVCHHYACREGRDVVGQTTAL